MIGRREPPEPSRRPAAMHTVIRALSVIAVAAMVAACSFAHSIPSQTPSGPLLTVEMRGGLCPEGMCKSVVVIERDGRIHAAAKPPNDLGTVPRGALAALEAAIRTADFAALKSHSFTEKCPTAYDGQEIIFEFTTPGGVQRISTCEVEVDFGDPLFVAVSTALGPLFPLPTT